MQLTAEILFMNVNALSSLGPDVTHCTLSERTANLNSDDVMDAHAMTELTDANASVKINPAPCRCTKSTGL